MHKDIDKMIARYVKSLEIVIESQRYICHRAAKWTVKPRFPKCIPAQGGYLDMGICLDMKPVIKDIGTLKCV